MTANRVLIVEDRIIVANNLQDRLQKMGYSVLGIVSSGEEAIRSVRELQPDIVLMDIRLQGEVDGIQAAQEIRTNWDVPVVYLTGHADETTLQRATLTEPYGYLLKPFDALGLRSTIEVALYRHANERIVRESEEKYRTLSGRLERRVEDLEEQVRHAQKMEVMGQLAGGIAHDFNNLLTVIHMSGTMLQRQINPEDPLLEHVEHIRSTATRAANLTAQLLNFGRRDVDNQQLLDFNLIIDNLDWMLQRLAGNDIVLIKTLDRNLELVQANSSQLELLIVNLVLNACDAMPEGGSLTVKTANVVLDEAYAAEHLGARPGPHIALTISDTGSGMDDEVKAHIFEPFFTTKKRGEGTGLGLTTVDGIVKQNGGHILVDSSVGQGTTFRVLLPSANGVAPAPKPELATLPDRINLGQTILVVEDEELVRDLTAHILKFRGYKVRVAGSGPEALQLSEQCSDDVHLLLVDLKMPQMDGLEVAQRLQIRWPQMRVLVMSGYSTDTDLVHKALDEGIPFLPKPFDLDTLVEKVQSVLDGEEKSE